MHATESEDRTPCRTHIFLSPVVSGTRTLVHFLIPRVCVAQVCTSHFVLVMLGVVCTIALKNTFSSFMSHPNLLGRRPDSFTSFFSVPSQAPQKTCSTKPERAWLTEIRYRSSETSPGGQFGCLADSVPLTDEGPREDAEIFQRLTLKDTARRIVLKERNSWLTPTESCESDETEAEDVKHFRALYRLARSSSRRSEGSRADTWVPH